MMWHAKAENEATFYPDQIKTMKSGKLGRNDTITITILWIQWKVINKI